MSDSLFKKNNDSYSQHIMPYSHEREVVWKEIVKILKVYISSNDYVLDIGAGHCHFINNIKCKKKFALDLSPETKKWANKDVIIFHGDGLDIHILGDQKFDIVFLSNLLEHLERNNIQNLLKNSRGKLNTDGKIIILQPNYRYASREYFDDFTHITPLDHVSLAQVLKISGYRILKIFPKFLPYSMDSKFTLFSNSFLFKWLVYIYLRFPIKFNAKQMLVIAKSN